MMRGSLASADYKKIDRFMSKGNTPLKHRTKNTNCPKYHM